MESTAATDRHTTFEDVQAIVTACAFFSLGLTLLGNARLLMGGTPGIALLISRVTHLRFCIYTSASGSGPACSSWGVDTAILVASLFVVSPMTLALSVLGAIALNLVLAVNHKPGRYMGA